MLELTSSTYPMPLEILDRAWRDGTGGRLATFRPPRAGSRSHGGEITRKSYRAGSSSLPGTRSAPRPGLRFRRRRKPPTAAPTVRRYWMGRRHRAVFPVRQPASNHWRRRSTHRLRGRNNRRSTRSTQPLHPHSYSVFVWEFMLDLLCCWTSFRKTCHEINREKVKQQIPRLLAITSPLPRCLQKHARFGRLRSAFSFWFPKGMSVLGDLFGRNHSGGAHSLFHPPQRHRPIRASHLARLHGIYASSCRHFRRVRHVDGV